MSSIEQFVGDRRPKLLKFVAYGVGLLALAACEPAAPGQATASTPPAAASSLAPESLAKGTPVYGTAQGEDGACARLTDGDIRTPVAMQQIGGRVMEEFVRDSLRLTQPNSCPPSVFIVRG